MSLFRLLRAAALAAATLLCVAGPAGAKSTTVPYSCTWPLIGSTPISVTWQTTGPQQIGVRQPASPVTAYPKGFDVDYDYSGPPYPFPPEFTGRGYADFTLSAPGEAPSTYLGEFEVFLVPGQLRLAVVPRPATAVPARTYPRAGQATVTAPATLTLELDGVRGYRRVTCTSASSEAARQIHAIQVVDAWLPLSGPFWTQLDGAVRIPSLIRGNARVTGFFNGTADGTGKVNGTFRPYDAQATLRSRAGLPITATLRFSPEYAEGTLSATGGTLRSAHDVRVPIATVFGIQLQIGETCRLDSRSEIVLTQRLLTPTTHTLAGTISTGRLTDCGFLDVLVDYDTASTGNQLELTMTQQLTAGA